MASAEWILLGSAAISLFVAISGYVGKPAWISSTRVAQMQETAKLVYRVEQLEREVRQLWDEIWRLKEHPRGRQFGDDRNAKN